MRTQLPGRQMNGTGSSNGSDNDMFIWNDSVDTESNHEFNSHDGR